MHLRHHRPGQLVAWAPAKINLFLEVLGERNDGYHELETLLVAVNLYDTLVFKEEPSGVLEFRCDDAALPQGPTNLVVRSAHLIREETGNQRRGVSIWLRKRIPARAGLGGGSSDAATTLAALNALWQLGLSAGDLAELAAQIGSDVPFFLHAPVAVGRGRGELLTPVTLTRPLHLVLVCPEEGVGTADVFRRDEPAGERRPLQPLLDALGRGDSDEIARSLFNRLEPTACRICPAITVALAALRASGLAGAAMTGSGSAAFGVARDRSQAVRAARMLRAQFPGRVHVVRSSPSWYAA
jgi:4-diphosphocytidyl-2-C-methyl-D-erythritol kinase